MTNTDASPTPRSTAPNPLAADDPRTHFAAAVAVAGDTLATVAPEHRDAPTPAGMTVSELCDHLVMVLRRTACAGRGEELATWPVEGGLGDASPDEVLAAWADAAHEVQEAWTDDALLERDITLPWTTLAGRDVMAIYTNELVVHTWDLARATGASPDWEDAVLATSERAIRAELPTADRGEMWAAVATSMPEGVPFDPPFANAVAVADDAPPIDRLVAWNGRTP